MHKKLIGAAVSVVALVALAAVPAIASASPTLMDGSGSVPAGSTIVGTNIGNTKMTTSLGTIECQHAELTGTVKKNSEGVIEGEIESASFTGEGSGGKCTTAFLGDIGVTVKRLPWCMKAGGKLAPDTFTVTSGACGGGGVMEFTLDSSLAGECTYTKAAVEGSFETGGEGHLTVSEQNFTKSAGGGFCPGSGKLDMTFTLETDNAEHEMIVVE